jgi:hypothetical protein
VTTTPQIPDTGPQFLVGSDAVTALLWPLVVVVLIAVLGGPVRGLLLALTEKVNTSHSGIFSTKWATFGWGERVDRVLGSLVTVPQVRSTGQAKTSFNAARIPATEPADLIVEAHGAVMSAIQELYGDREQPKPEDRDWLTPYIEVLVAQGELTDHLVEPIFVLDELYSMVRVSRASVDAKNADQFVRLAEAVLTRLPRSSEPYELYRAASNDMRRELNQAIFTRIFVVDQDRAESELQEHVRLLIEAQAEWAASFGIGIDIGTKENDAEASSSSESTEGNLREPVDLALGSSKQSLVRVQGL